jgi:formylglycine-generating enzyme required for sulfatase activity
VRSLRLLLAALPLAVVFACGSSESSSDDSSSGGRFPDGGVASADGGAIVSTCAKDGDCKNGGKCVDVGPGQKACVRSRSCTGGPGANKSCGGLPTNENAAGTDDCCKTLAVPGGSFNIFNDAQYPAKVSPYLLDAYEVTAGRFRAWVEATNGNLRANAPKPGDGAHPKVPNSGWRAEWDAFLPTSRAEVDQMLGPEKCQVGANLDDYGTLTWWTSALDAKIKQANGKNADVLAANTKEALDGKPINCIPWHVLFAFCVWDGGRLPTNAEWSFAAEGGAEQRDFPWGSVPAGDLVNISGRADLSLVPTWNAGQKFVVASLYDPSLGPNQLDPKYYVHTWGGKFRTTRDNAMHVAPVGRRVLGNGRFGHADLGGGMIEWMLDEGPVKPGQCNDCANVSWPANDQFDPNAAETIPDFAHKWYQGGARVIRGTAWDNSIGLANRQTAAEIEGYTSYPLLRTYRALGGRCARDL